VSLAGSNDKSMTFMLEELPADLILLWKQARTFVLIPVFVYNNRSNGLEIQPPQRLFIHVVNR
jgi:hypothetical protein